LPLSFRRSPVDDLPRVPSLSAASMDRATVGLATLAGGGAGGVAAAAFAAAAFCGGGGGGVAAEPRAVFVRGLFVVHHFSALAREELK
jgi:hypothetical protein